MHNFKVDAEKCISCGLCVKDCLFQLLELQDGHPALLYPDKCIGCLHCFAICPVGAITMDDHNASDAPLITPLPSAASMEALVRQRRSIRLYKQENCAQELINKLLQLAWDAPSGVNQHLLQITVIDDMAVMAELREKLYSGLESIALRDDLSAHTRRLLGILGPDMTKWRQEDRILRHAPHFTLAAYSDTAITGLPDAFIYLSYFESLAVTHGLGTLWCGYLDHCLRIMPELTNWLGIGANYKIAYPMLFGIPAEKYRRGINRAPVNINHVSTQLS